MDWRKTPLVFEFTIYSNFVIFVEFHQSGKTFCTIEHDYFVENALITVLLDIIDVKFIRGQQVSEAVVTVVLECFNQQINASVGQLGLKSLNSVVSGVALQHQVQNFIQITVGDLGDYF